MCSWWQQLFSLSFCDFRASLRPILVFWNIMKTLCLLRHAKSDWDNPALSDHDRPLNKRGRKAARRMARLIQDEQVDIDHVLCSTAVRTQETWARMQDEWADKPEATPVVVHERGLYLCEVDDIPPLIRRMPADCRSLLVIGHNPGMEEMLAALTGQPERFPTAALAVLHVEIDDWGEFSLDCPSRLKHLWRPRELPDDR
jgi:phosphohistidine phosphatase